jgi:hypothetical protein
MNKQKIMRDCERFLKRTEVYQNNRDLGGNYEIEFVLAKDNKDVIVCAVLDDEAIGFEPYRGQDSVTDYSIQTFYYGDIFFDRLKDGYKIVGMPLRAHFNVWADISEWHAPAVEYSKEKQIYLGYCKANNITLERLKREFPYNGIDLMTLYDGKTQGYTGVTNSQKEEVEER